MRVPMAAFLAKPIISDAERLALLKGNTDDARQRMNAVSVKDPRYLIRANLYALAVSEYMKEYHRQMQALRARKAQS